MKLPLQKRQLYNLLPKICGQVCKACANTIVDLVKEDLLGKIFRKCFLRTSEDLWSLEDDYSPQGQFIKNKSFYFQRRYTNLTNL